MKLVRLDNYLIVAEDELLLLQPFRKLYKLDKTRDKNKFFEFLTILYFTYDPRSDYGYIVDDTKRLTEVCESNGFSIPVFSELLKECVSLYKLLTTTLSQELLRSTKIAINKLRAFLENVDFNERDDKGKLIFTPQSLTSAIKLIPQLSKELVEAERAVSKEIEEKTRARGGSGNTFLSDGLESFMGI